MYASVSIPENSNEGDLLLGDSLFYRIYVNAQLYHFTSDLYPRIEEALGVDDVTDLPASLRDNPEDYTNYCFRDFGGEILLFSIRAVTFVKCGGSDMRQSFISEASLLGCATNPNMCRTQMLLRMEKPLYYFLERSIGNHHVIVPGRHAGAIEAVLQLVG